MYLKSQQRCSLNNLTINSERHSHEVHSVQKVRKGNSSNCRKVKTPYAMKEEERDEVLVIFLSDALSDPE